MSKLGAFAASNQSQFRMPKFPKLSDYIKAHGLVEGALKFDTDHDQAVQSLERLLNEQFSKINQRIPQGNA